MNLTKLSIERPSLLAVTLTILVFFGVFSYLKLNYELVPRFNPPVMTVATIYPGASPEEVESTLSIPVEDALSSLENVNVITTISKESFSLIRVELNPGTDIDLALQDASRKLQSISDKLPTSARKPILSRFDFNDLPVMRMALFSKMENTNFTLFSEEKILPALKKLPGIAEVRLLGGVKEEIAVHLNPGRMAAMHVTPLLVLKAMGSSNKNLPAGFIQSADYKSGIKYSGAFTSINDIRNLVIFEDPQLNYKVRLSDVATVTKMPQAPTVITRLNGKPALGIDIKKQADANALDLSKAVNEQLKLLESQHKNTGLKFEIAADTSTFTVKAANAVMEDLLLAVLLVSLVMLVFLHSMRSAAIVMISIPVSIITTFIVMEILGYSLNLLSLLGLSLAIGILVDDSIVVLENIHRHITMGKHPVKAAYEGRMEIGFTAITITLIDIVVFVPIIFASGMVADMLRQFSVVIVTSTLLSLFASFTLVPLLASRWEGKEKKTAQSRFKKIGIKIEGWMDQLANRLETIVKWALAHKAIVFIFTFLLFAGSVMLIPTGFIGVEFTKAGDRSEFIIELELEKTATLSKTDMVTTQVENLLMSYPEVEAVFTNAGVTSSGRIETNTSYLSEIFIRLNDKSKRDFTTSEFSRHIKNRILSTIPGIKVRPIEMSIIGIRDDDAVQVSLQGIHRDSLAQPAKLVYDLLDSIDGSAEIQTSFEEGVSGYEFKPDASKMELMGIDPLQAGMTLRTLVNGNTDFMFRENNQDKLINIIGGDAYRTSIEDVGEYTVLNNQGKTIPFNQFGVIREINSKGTLERTNRTPSVTIKSQVIGRPAGTVSNDLKSEIEKTTVSEKVNLLWGGASKRTTDALAVLGVGFAISIFLVYLVLVALYDSWFYPFAVLFSLPLAMTGALTAMALSAQALSIFSIMGLIMMTGLVGKNAILIVDFANILRRSGKQLEESVTEAVRLRLRPVLMTTLTIVIGLLPVALASGAGSEWKNGLAWALIGGLTSSLILTLIVIPVIYYTIEKLLIRFDRSELTRKKIKLDDFEA